MITGLRLGNFKAFAETQDIPIRPLTLIFGPNSSGKSSIIHGLILASKIVFWKPAEGVIHQGITHGPIPILGNLANKEDYHEVVRGVDLGGYKQFVHARDIKRNVKMEIEINIKNQLESLQGGVKKGENDYIALNEQADRGYEAEQIKHYFSSIYRVQISKTLGYSLNKTPYIVSYIIKADDNVLIKFNGDDSGEMKIQELNTNHPIFERILVEGYDAYATRSHPFTNLEDELDGESPTATQFVKGDQFADLEVEEEDLNKERDENAFSLQEMRNIALSEFSKITFNGLDFNHPGEKSDVALGAFLYSLKVFISFIEGYWEHLNPQYLGPMRSFPGRLLELSESRDPAWDVLLNDKKALVSVNKWLNYFKTNYEFRVKTREIIDPEKLKDIALLFSGTEFSFIDKELTGSHIDEYLMEKDYMEEEKIERRFKPKLPLEISRRLNETSKAIYESVKKIIRNASIKQIKDIILLDDRFSAEMEVHLPDVGFGISQIVPVIVSSLISRGKIICIEQPEIHLHPKLQAELGDVFIESALGKQKNTFVLETHSEHLILRIMRRMRETANGDLPSGIPPVRPEDVSILYVEPVGSSSVVRKLELDEEGQLLDPWPGGFFEEGFKERFSIS